MKNYLWLFLVLFLSIPVFIVSFSHHPVSITVENGSLVTGIAALDSIMEASSGKPVLINFWATWCGPCVRELPALEELALQFGDDIVFLAVDLGDPEFSTLELFRENSPIAITVVWLSVEDANLLAERYNLPDALPVTLIFDSELNEVNRAVGARNHEWFTAALEGASSDIVEEVVEEEIEVHIYVVGPSDDELVAVLIDEAILIAGEEGYDLLDPTIAADSVLMAEAYLPSSGWPYAQLCVGGACNRPVSTPGDLRAAYESMR